MIAPLAIDLFCGLGGWTEGLLAEGWRVIGFDIERHVYGEHRYPATLVLQDVRTLHGSQFRDAQLIVSSSPCQEFSYRAMPWKRAKALGPPVLGMELFAQAARIQREACEAAGRFIPMVQENVRGAQKWVGQARWHYGSYYLWGDVPALMPMAFRAEKNPGHVNQRDGHTRTRHLTNPAEHEGVKVGGLDWNKRIPGQAFNTTAERAIKNGGGSWFAVAHNTTSGKSQNARDQLVAQISADGVKQSGLAGPRTNGKGDGWFEDGAARHGSKSRARKAASAAIAKIPFPLACHIARSWKPTLASSGRGTPTLKDAAQ